MPDIKTALSRALTEWSKDEPDHQAQQPQPQPQPQPQEKAPMQASPPFAVSNNVTRSTFNFVRDNPGVSYAEALRALEAQGFKESSITALFSQMRRSGLIVRDVDGRYTAVGTEYVPMKATEKSNYKPTKYLTNKPTKAAPTPAPTPEPTPNPVVSTNDVDYLLNTLPIKQARDLYDALHKIFGGAR